MKEETHKAAIPMMICYSSLFGVTVPLIEVRKNKRKWGCCIDRKKIIFAADMCMLPPRLFEYVVAHEVCHIVVMDHSTRFWDLLGTVMPDHLQRQDELKRDTPLYRFIAD